MDIEFAIEAGVLWILQARPITTLGTGPVVTLDNANIVESYPGLTLPLTASFVPRVYYGVFRGLALRATRNERIVEKFDAVLRQMVVASSGRMYYRIDHWYQVLQVLPLSRRIIPVWQDMMGVQDRSYEDVRDRFTRWQRLRTWGNVLREFLATPAGMRRLETDVTELREHFRTRIADATTTEDLRLLFDEIEERALRRWDVTLLNDLHAFLWTGLLTATLRRAVDDPREAANAYISGIASIESMKPVRALVELAATAPADDLRGISTDAEARAYLDGEGEFPARLREYVDVFGDRFLEELKLESATFRSEPLLLLRTILTYCEDPGHLEEVRRSLSRPHHPDLPRARRPLVRWLARKAAQGIERRESSRLNRARVYGMVRQIVLRVGANLEAEGALDSASDVFWLTMDQLFEPTPHDLRRDVEHRRAEYEDFRRVPASRRLVFAGEMFHRRVNIESVASAVTRPDVLRGVPTSGGQARGRVRVVHDPRDVLDGHDGASGRAVPGGEILGHADDGSRLGLPSRHGQRPRLRTRVAALPHLDHRARARHPGRRRCRRRDDAPAGWRPGRRRRRPRRREGGARCLTFARLRRASRAAFGTSWRFPGRWTIPTWAAGTADARELLAGTHPLSRQCSVRAFVAYREGEPAGRVLLTRYEGQPELYLGFFECVDDEQVSAGLFEAAERVAADVGATAIVGPVDASFWVRYRLKASGFENAPYFSEPLNPPYYLRLFEAAGYAVSDTYVSHLFPGARPDQDFSAFEKHLDDLKARGVVIRSPHWWEWGRTLREIHGLLHELYSDFPVFAPIDYDDFRAIFRGFRLLADLSMVSIAHHEGEAVGFMVAMPDYPASIWTGSAARRLLTVARTRRHPGRYVLLYLGARPEYRGLGATMTGLVAREVNRRRAGAVGTLIHEGKVTERYAPDLVAARNTYVLLRKEL